MDLHVLGCPEHDLTISGKMSVRLCVRDKKFVVSVAQELTNRIKKKIIFSVSQT